MEVAWNKTHLVIERMPGDVLLEDRSNGRQIEAIGAQMRMRLRQLDWDAALCSADINDARVFVPWKLPGHGSRGRHTEGGHRFEKLAEARGVAIEFSEQIGTVPGFVLTLTRP